MQAPAWAAPRGRVPQLVCAEDMASPWEAELWDPSGIPRLPIPRTLRCCDRSEVSTSLLPHGKAGWHLMGPCCHPENKPGRSSERLTVTPSLLSFLVLSLDSQVTFPRRCAVFK